MGLRDDIPELLTAWKNQSELLAHNEKLFDVSEGNLLPLILDDLKKQLSENSFEQIQHRIAPINIMNKVVGKLSTIYSKPPMREIVGGKKRDQKSLGELIRVLSFDNAMSDANAFFNTFKTTWVEPYVYGRKPYVRSIPSDRFVVMSNDRIDPTKPTHFMKIMGKGKDNAVVFHAYTANEFLIFDSNEDVLTDLMAAAGNADGVNEYGALPGGYFNRSKYCLTPPPDTDMLAMTKLIPVLLSDCNFALMFQAFSIVYGIDVDDQNLKMAPNAFWRFKTSPTAGENKPQVGVLKPEVDTDKVLNLVKAEVGMWLDSKGIKPGAVGTLTPDNAASGIAKMIDESDTTEDRKKQVSIFAPQDSALLELIINKMLPVWKSNNEIDLEDAFLGQNVRIKAEFPEQKPMVDEGEQTDIEIKQIENKLTTRRRAIKKLNPDMTDEQVGELIAEIDNPQLDSADSTASDPSAANGADVRKETLNGAQIQSVVDLVQQVGLGNIPKEAAINIVITSFNLDRETAAGMFEGDLTPNDPSKISAGAKPQFGAQGASGTAPPTNVTTQTAQGKGS